MTRILVFSPYACRYHLSVYEGTIAKACQVRGATVEYILCDGLLPECDMHWDSFPSNNPRPFDICQSCQSRAKRNLMELDTPFRNLPIRWLGEFLGKEEMHRAFTWAQGMPAFEINKACFMGYPVGDWVRSSMVSYFRQYPPDMDNWRVVNAYRGFIYSAALVAIGLNNYLEAYSIDSALLFNGRQSITRVAFEIFQKVGIRTLIHEAPFFQRGHLLLKPNAKCWSPEPFIDFWRIWGQVPLTRPSLEKTLDWLKHRRYALGTSWFAFNPPNIGNLSIKKILNLNHDKRLLALFTSSTDEIDGDSELQGPYESQSLWVQDIIHWVKDRKDVELIIRVHPNLAGKTGLGKAVKEYDFYYNMKSNLPDNTRIIMPDDSLNSYALMDEADICLSFGTSVGLEMAMLGKPVVLGSRAFYECGSHYLTVRSKESLPDMLEKSLQPVLQREIRREAFRLAYYYVFKFELDFPLVSMVDVVNAKLNYSVVEALAEKKDETLDHICNYLINGQQLFDSPNESDLSRATTTEDDFFSELESLKNPYCDNNYERWLRRTNWINLFGRSVQNIIHRIPLGTRILNNVGKSIYLPILRWAGRRTKVGSTFR